jgi:paraquat-inducible protein A
VSRVAAAHLGLAACHACGLLQRVPEAPARCQRCGARLHLRKPESIPRTWAFVVAAAIMYLPANLLPIMASTQLGERREDTILSGVLHLLHLDMWPLALIVFVASVLVPLFKLLALVVLLLSVQRRHRAAPRERVRLFNLTELVGRWSMVDVFVIGLLTALVQMGNLASVQPGPGATAFALVVVLTMLATQSFDPRLIWDRLDDEPARGA